MTSKDCDRRFGIGGGTVDSGDHRELNPRVRELGDRDSLLPGGYASKLIEDPLRSLFPGGRRVVAVVECGQAIQGRFHVGDGEGVEQKLDVILVGWGRD